MGDKNTSTPKKKISWIPLPFEFMVASVSITYIVSVAAFVAEWKYVQIGVLLLYLVDMWINSCLDLANLTRADKMQTLVQQTTLSTALVSPLIVMVFKH